MKYNERNVADELSKKNYERISSGNQGKTLRFSDAAKN